MKKLAGSIRPKVQKIFGFLLVLLLVFAAVLIYNHYIHGQIKIDSSLVTDENLNLVAENWEKLVDTGKFNVVLEGEDSKVLTSSMYNFDAPIEDGFGTFAIEIYILNRDHGETASGNSSLFSNAHYERKGIYKAIITPVRFGECKNYFYIGNSHCAVSMIEWDAPPTADRFNQVFQEILSTAKETF